MTVPAVETVDDNVLAVFADWLTVKLRHRPRNRWGAADWSAVLGGEIETTSMPTYWSCWSCLDLWFLPL